MWKLKPGERIARWRDFRKTLNTLTLEQAVAAVANYWQSCPFTPYYLDTDNHKSWPDPWTLIHENYYCDLAKCLGIVYTLCLTDHNIHIEPEIRVYQDPVTKVTYNLAWFNQGKYILNMSDAEVVNIEHFKEALVLKYCFTAQDLKLEEFI
jgi:hypothetical protein